MKSKFLFSVLAVCVALSGCSKQIYSHEQVMLSFHTKDDVIRQFGQPNEIIASNDTVQWLYDCSSESVLARTKTKVKINGTYNSSTGLYTVPVSVSQFTPFESYVKFSFNKKGEVLARNARGINFAQRKAKPLATIGVVFASGLVVLSVIGSIIWLAEFSNWGK